MTISFIGDSDWDLRAIRRAIRVLASHSPGLADHDATLRALRLLWDMLDRRGIPCSLVEPAGTLPLVVAGSGPLLVVVHLDDISAPAQHAEPAPPSIADGQVVAPGIVRRANVLAAVGMLLADPAAAERVTLVVEADRHRGSLALERWLASLPAGTRWPTAACDVEDQPIPTPALLRGAQGRVTLELIIDGPADVEQTLAGVAPDIGHRLAAAVAALGSAENEVRVPGFYDGIVTPESDELEALAALGGPIEQRLAAAGAQSATPLGARHLALGAYLAPSITVRALELPDSAPWLPARARALVEVRMMPGQNTGALVSACVALLHERAPELRVTPLLVRPPATGVLPPRARELARCVLPVALGNSPAGLLEAAGSATVGFALLGPEPGVPDERVSLAAILDGTRTLAALAEALGNGG